MRRTSSLPFVAIVLLLLVPALVTSWSVQAQSKNTAPQLTASSTTSIAAGTPAVIVSAVVGKSITVKSLMLATVTTGGIVTFYDGANAAAPIGLNVYVPASTSVNNNVYLPPELVRGITTTTGNALCAQLNGCTLVYTVEYQTQ